MNNDKILSYINSKDIRQHLKNIQYSFNSVETAWLIYQCQHLTIEEKHQEWRELISAMPDMSLESRAWGEPIKSLHKFLCQYMSVEKQWIKNFLKSDNMIYSFDICYENHIGSETDCVFSTYEACLSAIATVKKIQDNYTIEVTRKEINPNDRTEDMVIELTSDLKILSVNYLYPHRKHHFCMAFKEMWFSFPTPFVKGDIIHDITRNSVEDYCYGPVVMDMIAPDYFSENGRKGFDISDMCVWGYFQNTNNGSIYKETAYNYMNFEYYPKEQLTGKRRVLLTLSNYLKGKIDISLFAKAYHQILTEEYAKELIPKGITAEGLTLAGLNNE